jgi:hypothetical protein
VKVAGLSVGAKGTRYDYGLAANEAGAGITNAPIEGLGATFTVTVPAYSLTTVVIPLAK